MRLTIQIGSNRTLIVATALSVVAITNVVGVRANEMLKPSLYAFVLKAELEQVRKAIEVRETTALGGGPLPRDTPDRIFLALAFSDEDPGWVAPPNSLIERIGSESVRSVKELQGNNPVYLLNNIIWIDAHTVVLDKEQIQGHAHSAMRKMKLSIENGKWKVIDEGEYWEEDDADAKPFRTSNSGQPIQ